MTDATNAGTYNYYNPEGVGYDHPFISSNSEHGAFDVIPYYLLGNDALDNTKLSNRIFRNVLWGKEITKEFANDVLKKNK